MHKRPRVPVPSLKQSGKTTQTIFPSSFSLLKIRKLVAGKPSSLPKQLNVTAPIFGHNFSYPKTEGEEPSLTDRVRSLFDVSVKMLLLEK